MKVLQLCNKPPFPPVDGGTLAMNSITQGLLSAGCEVKVLSMTTDKHPVLDEPSVGLHPQDISRLKNSLRHLRDHGNTILIVEHHREIIAMADHIVDMGPGAGDHGGEIMFEGGYKSLLASDTVTGRMLRHVTPLKNNYRTPTGWFHIKDARLHNLQHIDVDIPKSSSLRPSCR